MNKSEDSTREKIKYTAARLFAKNGFKGTSIKNIAEEAGINKALIFYYFKNKENLYAKILQERMSISFESIREAIEKHSDPARKIEAILEALTEIYASNSKDNFFQIEFQDGFLWCERIKLQLMHYRSILMKTIIGIIQNGIENGVFKQIDAELTANSMFLLLHGFLKTTDLFGTAIEKKRISLFFKTLFLKGLLV